MRELLLRPLFQTANDMTLILMSTEVQKQTNYKTLFVVLRHTGNILTLFYCCGLTSCRAGVHNSNLMAGQNFFSPYPRAKMICFNPFQGYIYQESKLKV